MTIAWRDRLVPFASCLGVLAVGDNSTAIMAALPSVAAALRLSPALLQWVVNAYLLASAIFIMLGGAAADRFGARRSTAAGLALFALASVVIALARNGDAMLLGRTMQGIGAAFAVPGSLAAMNAATAPDRRAAAIGAWTGFLLLGFSLGPLIGGALTHFIGWSTIFWLSAVLSALAAVGMALAGAEATARPSVTRRLDWPGFLLLGTFMLSLALGLQGLAHASGVWRGVVLPLGLAALSLALLVAVERRAASPLVDPHFFRLRRFVLGLGIGALGMLNIMALLLFFSLFAQRRDGLGLSVIETGAMLLPLGAALLALALSAARLTARLGPRMAIAAGASVLVLACGVSWAAIALANLVLLCGGLALAGAGIAVPYAAAPRLALAALPPGRAGEGAGIVNACTFLGGSVGVSIGALAMAHADFPGVLAMIACAGALSVGLASLITDPEGAD